MAHRGAKGVLVAIAALLLWLPVIVEAEEVLCITLFVCDRETGEILPEYDDPGQQCFMQFQAQCSAYKAYLESQRAEDAERSAALCNSELSELEIRIRRLKRRLGKRRQSSS